MPDDKTLDAGKILGYMGQYMRDAYIKDLEKRMEQMQKSINELKTGVADITTGTPLPSEFPKVNVDLYKSIPEYRHQYLASLVEFTKILESREQIDSSRKLVLYSLEATDSETMKLANRVDSLMSVQYPKAKIEDSFSPNYIDDVKKVIDETIEMTKEWAAPNGVIIRNRFEQSEHALNLIKHFKQNYQGEIKNDLFNDAENYFRGRISAGVNDSRNEYWVHVGNYDNRNFDMTAKDPYSLIKPPIKEVAILYASREQEKDKNMLDRLEHHKHVHSPSHSR